MEEENKSRPLSKKRKLTVIDKLGKLQKTNRSTTQKDAEDTLLAESTFEIGESKQIFKASSYLLANSSEVFKAMLFGEFFKNRIVEIPDVEPDAFSTVLRFLRGKQVNFLGMTHATNVCYAAEKYNLEGLKQMCAEYLYPSNLHEMWMALETGVLYNIMLLKLAALKLIRKDTYSVLNSQYFLKLSRNSLKYILQDNWLDVHSEREIVDAVMEWAKQRCSTEGKEVSKANMREALGDVVHELRFLTMDKTELLEYGKYILTEEEITSLMQYVDKGSEADVSLPDSLSKSSLKRKRKGCSQMAGVVTKIKFDVPSNVKLNSFIDKLEQSLCFKRNLNLLSVNIPTRISSNTETEYYFEEVVLNLMHESNVIVSRTFTGKVKYNDTIEIRTITPAHKYPCLSSKHIYKFELLLKRKGYSLPLQLCRFSQVEILKGPEKYSYEMSDSYSFIVGLEYSI